MGSRNATANAKRDQPCIVFDARSVRSNSGGVATYVQALIEHLPRLLPTTEFVLLRHPLRRIPLSSAPNVIEWELGRLPHHPWTLFGLGRWLRARVGRHALFHAPYQLLPLELPCPGVLTLHDAMEVFCPELVIPVPVMWRVLQKVFAAAIGGSLRRAARVLVPSRCSEADAVRLEPACRDRIVLTAEGVSESFRPMTAALALAETAAIVPASERFFLVLGDGTPQKNHAAAVTAFARAFGSDEPISLLIIEHRWTLPRHLRITIAQNRAGDRVRVRPRVTFEQLLGLYARAVALVVPSLYEGFGLPVLEAMACGCPVIVSRAASLPEVAGDAALMCDPQDPASIGGAMRRMLDEDALRERLRSAGFRRAQQFSWAQTAFETASAYREAAPWLPAPLPTGLSRRS
jgi:glycosyltransferase involved in cell wall biosynthesis